MSFNSYLEKATHGSTTKLSVLPLPGGRWALSEVKLALGGLRRNIQKL